MDKKLILVHYVFVGDEEVSFRQKQIHLRRFSDSVHHISPDSEHFILVVEKRENARIECINPVQLKEDEYGKVLEKLTEYKSTLTKFMEDIANTPVEKLSDNS